jgi:hypothetical protein
MLGWDLVIPEHAEIISSIGDALSLLRAERERTVAQADAATIERMMAEVEDEVVAAGASPASVEVRLEEEPERSTVRAVATGAIALSSGALPGRPETDEAQVARDAPPGATVRRAGLFWVTVDGHHIRVLDRYGDEVAAVDGVMSREATLESDIERLTRHRGPVLLRPSVWIIDERRLIELATPGAAADDFTGRAAVTYLVGRSR